MVTFRRIEHTLYPRVPGLHYTSLALSSLSVCAVSGNLAVVPLHASCSPTIFCTSRNSTLYQVNCFPPLPPPRLFRNRTRKVRFSIGKLFHRSVPSTKQPSVPVAAAAVLFFSVVFHMKPLFRYFLHISTGGIRYSSSCHHRRYAAPSTHLDDISVRTIFPGQVTSCVSQITSINKYQCEESVCANFFY